MVQGRRHRVNYATASHLLANVPASLPKEPVQTITTDLWFAP
jgi:hypothetical protein